jgi:regulator of CtrA degradation
MSGYTLECNRITSGIMQAISWRLMQKGVHSGEITAEEASLKDNCLSDDKLFFKGIGCDTSELPEGFNFVSERTRNLYNRIVRVDRLLYENKDKGINPVHVMINKIENTGNI